MTQPLLGFLAFAVGTVVVLTVPVLAVWLVVHLAKALGFVVGGVGKGIGAVVRHVARFVKGEVVDTLQFAGGIMTAGVIVPLTVANAAIGRFRAAKHYAAAIEDELTGAIVSLYRVGLGHPVRLLGLGALTDGLERRLPELVAREPRTAPVGQARRVARHVDETPAFDGYSIQKELQAGGSGARLFLAIPTAERTAELTRRGMDVPGRVVIKAFDRGYGSTIPQIVRESRSLEAAKRLGLILEHDVDEDKFHYVMPFVPGDDLDAVTRQMHARSTGEGLDSRGLAAVLGYARDLCDHLDRFHREGLWHKDVKPSNLMVADGRLHVVDFGLVTPLESALTLTTHGTEFFRDPELVRLALAGRRVKDVDGVKFDLYSAGAVLYSMLENSFPAHGSLSSITKPVPEALRWIVRRSMADVDKRYASAAEMARDLDVLIAARDPFSVRPADLPSVRGDAAPPRPRAATASFAAGLGADAERDAYDAGFGSKAANTDDVRRFSAFGMTAEVHGLDRIKNSLHTARAGRKRRRAEAQAARERAAEAARQEKEDAKLARRSQRRGMLRAGLILAIFVGILGGTATFLQEHRGSYVEGPSSDSYAHAFEMPSPGPAPAFVPEAPQSPNWEFKTSMKDALADLGPFARVLVVSDPSDDRLTKEAREAAKRLRALGIEPIGVPIDARTIVRGEDIALLAEAQYQIEQARSSSGSANDHLRAFVENQPGVDAIVVLERNARTGHLRASLAAPASMQDACEESSADACLESTSCVEDGRSSSGALVRH